MYMYRLSYLMLLCLKMSNLGNICSVTMFNYCVQTCQNSESITVRSERVNYIYFGVPSSMQQTLHKYTQWEISSLCQWPDIPVGKRYKVAMNVHHHKSVSFLMWLYMLPGCTTQTSHPHTHIYHAHITSGLVQYDGQLVEFYILATSKVVSGYVPTCGYCTVLYNWET